MIEKKSNIYKGRYVGVYANTIETYFESLKLTLRRRKEELGLKNEDIYPENEYEHKDIENVTHRKRVSRILNNKKSPGYQNLMSESETKIFTKNLKFKNDNDMLWEHIDFNMMYTNIIQDGIDKNIPKHLNDIFEKNLMSYVPYAKVYQEWTQENYPKVWRTESELMGLRKEAAKWFYEKERKRNVLKLKQMFNKCFNDKGLWKFSKKCSQFISEYFEMISTVKKSNQIFFGRQAAMYQQDYLKITELLHTKDDYVYFSKMDDEAKLLRKYLKVTQENIDELENFQKEFNKCKINL